MNEVGLFLFEIYILVVFNQKLAPGSALIAGDGCLEHLVLNASAIGQECHERQKYSHFLQFNLF